MIKIYHHYELWEDYKAGMYNSIHGKAKNIMLNKAIIFTGNANLYGEYMLKVIKSWPISCEQNLTDSSLNKKAWIGHAAACMAIGSPEDITRMAWGCLSFKQQDDANEQADKFIKVWIDENKNKTIYKKMGKTGVQEWDSRRSAYKTRNYVQSSVISYDMQGNSQERLRFN